MKKLGTVFAFVLLIAAAPAWAEPVTTLADIDFWVGQGQNESALVIDFANGSDPVVWGYRYDGPATAEDMLLDITAADNRLYSKIGTAGSFGLPLFGIGYDRNDNGAFGLDDGTIFDPDGIAVVASNMADGAMVTDLGDDYGEGWLSDVFCALYIADDSPYDGSDNWDSALTGFSGRNLTDGSWDGLAFAPGFVGTEPGQPMTSGSSAAVPEPASLAGMLICAFAALAGYRVTRRRHV